MKRNRQRFHAKPCRKSMRNHWQLGVVFLLSLALPQVFCGDESLSYIIRPMTVNETCPNLTTFGHPTKFDECPLPPFRIVDKDYSAIGSEVNEIKLAKNALPRACYDQIVKTSCIMSLELCTADGYVVGMYNPDVCFKYFECGVPGFGVPPLKLMCQMLAADRTSTVYNGTDKPIYAVVEATEQSTGAANSLHTSLIPHLIAIVPALYVFANFV